MRINSFSKTYGKEKVLLFDGFDIEKGKVYAIIGSNGSGKSTFAKILSGVIQSDQKNNPFDDMISVGYMPQKSLGFRMSVKKNIALNSNDKDKIDYLIDSLALTKLSEKNASTLSGGETERVALARLLVKEYDCLVLDEPTSAMDMEKTIMAEALIKEYVKETNATIFLITHSLRQAARMSDYVMYFKNGILVETDETKTLLENPKEKETAEFLEFNGK